MQMANLHRLVGKTDAEFEEKMLEGKALLLTRNGIFQVRLYNGKRQYICKSFKTRDLTKASELAVRAYCELEFRKQEQLPLQIKHTSDVLNEYERLRESQNEVVPVFRTGLQLC